MTFSLLLHFRQIKNHPQALATTCQAWQEHFKLPLLLFRGKGPGQKLTALQLRRLAVFAPKDRELYFTFKESLKRHAAKLKIWFARPGDKEFAGDEFQEEESCDLNYLSAALTDDWFRRTGATAAEAAVIGFISAVSEIGTLKDAVFEHDDIALHSPALELRGAISAEFSCKPAHLFFANAHLRDAYGGAANWKNAGFRVHAKWKKGWLVGLPLNYEPNTVEAAWRLFDALEKLGIYRRGQIKPNLLKLCVLSLPQTGDFLASYEKKLGRVFGYKTTKGIDASADSTSFGPQAVAAKPAVGVAPREAAAPTAKPTKKLQPIAPVPQESELDEIFEAFAQGFLGKLKDGTPIAFATKLARDRLDYSLDSLKLVDEYLFQLHQNQTRIRDEDWHSTVLYAGAYLGEVIRRATKGRYRWIDYEEYIPAHPELQKLIGERNSATCAFLVDDEDLMFMPLNKIARFIDEGPEHSLHYFAHVSMQEPKERKSKLKKRPRK